MRLRSAIENLAYIFPNVIMNNRAKWLYSIYYTIMVDLHRNQLRQHQNLFTTKFIHCSLFIPCRLYYTSHPNCVLLAPRYQATFTILSSLVHAQQPITAETSLTSTKKSLDSTTTCLLGPGPCSQQHCLIIFVQTHIQRCTQIIYQYV